MRRAHLIVTADDFGVSPGVNEAVLEAHRAGALTCASLAVTGEAWREAARMAIATPSLEVGLHFVLAAGAPVLPAGSVSSLVSHDLMFHKRDGLALRALSGRLRRSDVALELEAQTQRFLSVGLRPAFINGDQHVHVLPVVREVVIEKAVSLGIPVRAPNERFAGGFGSILGGSVRKAPRLMSKMLLRVGAHAFLVLAKRSGVVTNQWFASPFGLWPDARFDVYAFIQLVKNLDVGVTELMVHPAYPDDGLARFWRIPLGELDHRKQELYTLLDADFRNLLMDSSIELTTFSLLRKNGE
jgi:predicted glycoside hydrolase/deacetylase ChbG (UPF0249 family)